MNRVNAVSDVLLTANVHTGTGDGVVASPAAPQRRSGPGLSSHLKQRIARDFQERFQREWGGKFVTQGIAPGTNAVRLDGNDYLSVTGHPSIVQAQVNGLRCSQDYIVQSGVFLAEGSPTGRFEDALSGFIGHAGGVLCQSGYTANLGLLQVIADRETTVYVDSLAHMSLWEGVRAAGATAQAFRHNDPEHLARMMKRHGPGLVIVDSVYSTTGAVCPLREIVEIVEANESMILVDESHSLGTHGPGGRGLCAELDLTHRVHFITASLAKAFAGRAGFFTLPDELRNYLMCHSFPNIFSSALLPHEVAGLSATLDVIKQSDRAREQLRHNTRRIRSSLSELGYPIHQGTEQIISLEAGPEVDTLALRDSLEGHGVFGAVFCAPATSRNRSMVRLTLNASLTEAEMSHVEQVAAEIAPKIKPWDWPIARRQRGREADQSST
ncbi:quorum-sensing autoinducer CAI-1 synthase [Ramlibacter sp. AW1]|uniref:Quorum-sensing autoinducer CAI-1 synthase n=1 Tax=Ramlibacter aurantiacus TaxID=2801330 RepID=A0A936ZM24_9BURK|nr:alpha-hydroxyketone-type quorum-sensing autoinducer synthase [Ramlibacter aurantiacus]MBL0422282.1 quorum-sensing autoinducer CAI-1 synthase [Ramlibacter aurantiacus]